jgi:hypothetical protein
MRPAIQILGDAGEPLAPVAEAWELYATREREIRLQFARNQHMRRAYHVVNEHDSDVPAAMYCGRVLAALIVFDVGEYSGRWTFTEYSKSLTPPPLGNMLRYFMERTCVECLQAWMTRTAQREVLAQRIFAEGKHGRAT